MKKLNMIMLIGGLVFTLKSQQLLSQSTETEKAIRATALDYIEGWYRADTVRIAKALSPELRKIGFTIDKKTNTLSKVEATYPQMLMWTGRKSDDFKQNQNIDIKVDIMAVGENIAMVKTIAPHFIDYIHMGKMNGEWKIYNVIWEPNTSDSK